MRTKIIVSSYDLERLESLLHARRVNATPIVTALQGELDRAEVVEPQKVPKNLVTMNSTVRFKLENEEEEKEMTLSYPWDSEKQDKPRISVLTPIGSALLGLKVGQSINWQVPEGKQIRLKVTTMVWQPEQNGQDLGE